MANRFFVNGGVDNNWGTTGNWSTTSGGGGGSAVPLSSDDVFFDLNSPNCTVNTSARVCRQLDFNTYTNTITMTNGITATPQNTGIVRFASGMTLAGSSTLTITAATACTITTAGLAITIPITLSGTGTFTLGDNWDQDALLTLGGASNLTLNANTITFSSSLTLNRTISGTTNYVANGTGTWSQGASGLFNASGTFTINTAGTLTMSGTVSWGASGTFTYTAGTVVTTGSTMRFNPITTLTINAAGINFNHVDFQSSTASTTTLSGNLNVLGDFSITTSNQNINGNIINISGSLTLTGASYGSGSTSVLKMIGTGSITTNGAEIIRGPLTIDTAGTVTFAGTVNFNNSTLTYTSGTVAWSGTPILVINTAASTTILDLNGLVWQGEIRNITAGVIVRLASSLIIGGSGGKLTFTGTVASPTVLNSTSAGVQRTLTIQPGAIIDIIYNTFTDIDCSSGDKLWGAKSTQSNSLNIGTVFPYTSPLGVFVGGGESSLVFGG